MQATGRGAYVVAAIAGYAVGSLCIPGHDLPWEKDAREAWQYPANLALPREIAIDASNAASDYGNKFGEPVICGFVRSFGMRLPTAADQAAAEAAGGAAASSATSKQAAEKAGDVQGERREWIKPIMFSAGIGQLDATHCVKGTPEPGMLVVKIGGPAYRIGMGGGAASSRASDEGSAALDFNAVQVRRETRDVCAHSRRLCGASAAPAGCSLRARSLPLLARRPARSPFSTPNATHNATLPPPTLPPALSAATPRWRIR